MHLGHCSPRHRPPPHRSAQQGGRARGLERLHYGKRRNPTRQHSATAETEFNTNQAHCCAGTRNTEFLPQLSGLSHSLCSSFHLAPGAACPPCLAYLPQPAPSDSNVPNTRDVRGFTGRVTAATGSVPAEYEPQAAGAGGLCARLPDCPPVSGKPPKAPGTCTVVD